MNMTDSVFTSFIFKQLPNESRKRKGENSQKFYKNPLVYRNEEEMPVKFPLKDSNSGKERRVQTFKKERSRE